MGGRLPVDGKKVQEFRITLGTFERDRLDTLISSLAFKNVATPTISLLNDATGMIAIVAIIDQLFGYQILQQGTETLEDLIFDIKSFNERRKENRDATGNISDYTGQGLITEFLKILEGFGDIQRTVLEGAP
tara:strand:+ start:230 stop:625 length:396 start_codon:yes stop_codon:yes gene_type:complete